MKLTIFFLLTPLVIFSQRGEEELIVSYYQGGPADPYTPGTNLFPAMAGNVDSPDSTTEWPGGWTEDAPGYYDLETTEVRSGSTSVKYTGGHGTDCNDRITSFGFNPVGEGAGVTYRWEGYYKMPAGQNSGDCIHLVVDDAVKNPPAFFEFDETQTAWTFFSFQFTQESTNTFVFKIEGTEIVYLDDMKLVIIP